MASQRGQSKLTLSGEAFNVFKMPRALRAEILTSTYATPVAQ